LKVEISPNPGSPAAASGQLVFIDNTVNPTTGTITLKARVKNEKEALWPGQFIAARIILRVEKDAMVLPEAAVLPGQSGTFVYAVREGRAKVQAVTVDRQVGGRMVISKGLTGDEEVLVNVPPSVTDGSPVVLRGSADGKGENGAAAKEGGKGGEGKGKKVKDAPAKDEASKEAK
jgi:multidrug efflux system membrane fusion protein